MTSIQRNSIGVKVVVNVVDASGDPVTLSSATNLKIKMRPTVGAGITKDATLEGTTAVSCLTVDGDLDSVGVWQAQAYYELNGFKGHTAPIEIFTVLENLN